MKLKSEYSGTLLAVAYVHLKPYSLKESQLQELENFREQAYALSRDIYRMDVRVFSEYEEGSLKHWLAVVGGLFLGIGNYGDFRSGVDYLINDAKQLAEKANHLFIQDLHPNQKQVFRTERRGAVPAILKVVIHQIDSLAADISNLSPNQVTERLHDIEERLQRAIDLSHSNEDQDFILRETMHLIDDHFPSPSSSQSANKAPVYAWRRELEYLIEEDGGNKPRRIVRRLYLH